MRKLEHVSGRQSLHLIRENPNVPNGDNEGYQENNANIQTDNIEYPKNSDGIYWSVEFLLYKQVQVV